jgi:hypothetical protein
VGDIERPGIKFRLPPSKPGDWIDTSDEGLAVLRRADGRTIAAMSREAHDEMIDRGNITISGAPSSGATTGGGTIQVTAFTADRLDDLPHKNRKDRRTARAKARRRTP